MTRGPRPVPRPVLTCAQCGCEFTGSGHLGRASRQKYCSRTCTIRASARAKLSADQKAEMVALVAAGWGRADVAAAYGVTAGAIYYHEKQSILKVGRS